MLPKGRVTPGRRRTLERLEPHEGEVRKDQGGSGGKPWRREGQESCRRTGRVKPAGERGAPERAQSSRVGLSPRWKPVCVSGRGASPRDGRGTGRSAAVRVGESPEAGKETVKGG